MDRFTEESPLTFAARRQDDDWQDEDEALTALLLSRVRDEETGCTSAEMAEANQRARAAAHRRIQADFLRGLDAIGKVVELDLEARLKQRSAA